MLLGGRSVPDSRHRNRSVVPNSCCCDALARWQDTANVALFLASELGSFVTGLYIPVCGGQVME